MSETSRPGVPEPGDRPKRIEPTELEQLPEEVEPTTTGTLFIMVIFLMALGGMWAIMYLRLLER